MKTHMRWMHFFNILLTAITLALPITTVCLAFSQMIYSGNHLDSFIPIGASLIIVATSLFLIITAVFSQFSTAIGYPQSESLPILLLIVGSIATHVTTTHAILPSVVIAIILSTCLTGLFFLILGIFNLGNLIRFVPFSVVAGFIACTGWLVILAALSHASEVENFIYHPFQIFSDQFLLARIIPTLLFGLVLFSLTKFFRSPFVIPGMLVVGIILFYITIMLTNVSLSTLRTHHFLFPVMTNQSLVTISDFSYNEIAWSVILSQIGKMCAVALISAFALLFISSALELNLKKDINLNRELVSLGIGNLLIGLMGSTPSYPALALSTLNHEMKANTRWVGIVCALICLITVFYGRFLIPFVPKFVLNGLIVFMGMNLLTGWTIKIRNKLNTTDKIIILSIFIAVNMVGIMEGILFGIVLSIIFFVIKYSRISPIKAIFTGIELHSKKQRNPVAQQIIMNQGKSILIFKLQNYLFFGSANQILEVLFEKVASSKNIIEYLIYDLENVSGIDSSLTITFEKIKQFTQKHSITLIFTGLNENIYHTMTSINILNKNDASYFIISNADKALEKCEEMILEKAKYAFPVKIPADEMLVDATLNKEMILTMMTYFDEIKLEKGSFLFHKDDPSNNLYYLESGYLTVLLGIGNDTNNRLSTIGPGNIIGEIGFYLKTPRTASIVAEEDCLLKYISPEKFAQIHRENPIIAAQLSKVVIRFISSKLIIMNEDL